MLFKDQFGIKQNLQMSPIPQTSFLVGTCQVAGVTNRDVLLTATWC